MKYIFYSWHPLIVVIIIGIIMSSLTLSGQNDTVYNKDALPNNADSIMLVKGKKQLESIIPIQKYIIKSQHEQIFANQDTLLIWATKKTNDSINRVKRYARRRISFRRHNIKINQK